MNIYLKFENISLYNLLKFIVWGIILCSCDNDVLSPSDQNDSQDSIVNESILFAGAAVSKINPPLGFNVVGAYDPKPGVFINDDIHSRAIVLENKLERIVIVIVDNLKLPRDLLDEAKRLLNNRLGIKYENILIAATHTHSSVSSTA